MLSDLQAIVQGLQLQEYLLQQLKGGDCDFLFVVQDNRGSGSSKGHTLNDYSLMDTIPDPFVQNLFVLRHGEQLNQLEVQPGAVKAARPWDPPLTDKGKLQAWTVGRNMKLEDWNITRVVMSPSLRCVQTAVEIIAGLCMLPSSLEMREKGNGSPYVSTIKVCAGYISPFCCFLFIVK